MYSRGQRADIRIERNVIGTDITSERNVQGTDIISKRKVQGTDISYRWNVQGLTLQGNSKPDYYIRAHKTSLLYRFL